MVEVTSKDSEQEHDGEEFVYVKTGDPLIPPINYCMVEDDL